MKLDEVVHWKEWTPWLYHEEHIVSDILTTIDHTPKIPWVVRLFENPSSPFYLPAPTTMAMHDTIHILLGRGLLNQDEAFVIGFGMGTSLGSTEIKRMVFEFVSSTLYPKFYRLNDNDLKVFNLAFDFAQKTNIRNLHLENERQLGRMTVKELRAYYGLDDEILKGWYEQEKALIEDSVVSRRLRII